MTVIFWVFWATMIIAHQLARRNCPMVELLQKMSWDRIKQTRLIADIVVGLFSFRLNKIFAVWWDYATKRKTDQYRGLSSLAIIISGGESHKQYHYNQRRTHGISVHQNQIPCVREIRSDPIKDARRVSESLVFTRNSDYEQKRRSLNKKDAKFLLIFTPSNRLNVELLSPIFSASSACLILFRFISSCMRSRIVPGRAFCSFILLKEPPSWTSIIIISYSDTDVNRNRC